MTLFKKAFAAINRSPMAKLFFILLMASFIVVPTFVYVYYFDIITDVDQFVGRKFKDGKITAVHIVERSTSRGHYDRIEVNGEDLTYPVLVVGLNPHLEVGDVISKDAGSAHFTIHNRFTTLKCELTDQRRSRTTMLIVTMTSTAAFMTLLMFLNVFVAKKQR